MDLHLVSRGVIQFIACRIELDDVSVHQIAEAFDILIGLHRDIRPFSRLPVDVKREIIPKCIASGNETVLRDISGGIAEPIAERISCLLPLT